MSPMFRKNQQLTNPHQQKQVQGKGEEGRKGGKGGREARRKEGTHVGGGGRKQSSEGQAASHAVMLHEAQKGPLTPKLSPET